MFTAMPLRNSHLHSKLWMKWAVRTEEIETSQYPRNRENAVVRFQKSAVSAPNKTYIPCTVYNVHMLFWPYVVNLHKASMLKITSLPRNKHAKLLMAYDFNNSPMKTVPDAACQVTSQKVCSLLSWPKKLQWLNFRLLFWHLLFSDSVHLSVVRYQRHFSSFMGFVDSIET